VLRVSNLRALSVDLELRQLTQDLRDSIVVIEVAVAMPVKVAVKAIIFQAAKKCQSLTAMASSENIFKS
jgi:hypothetical protein